MDKQLENFMKMMDAVIHGKETDLSAPDWQYLSSLAMAHNLLSLFVIKAQAYPDFAKAHADLIKESIKIVAQQMIITDTFLEVYREFAESGIYPLVMKGIICRQLYAPYEDYRPSGDEDILISTEDFSKVKSVLVKNGYRTSYKGENADDLKNVQEITFFYQNNPAVIEVHFNAIGRENAFRVNMNDCFEGAMQRSMTVNIGGTDIRTMNYTDHFLYLVLHAFKHFTAGGFGVRMLLDILLFYEQYAGVIDANYIWQKAEDVGATRFFADLLAIGNAYLGCNLPCNIPPHCPDKLLEDIVQSGTFGSNTKVQKTAVQLTNAAMETGGTNNSAYRLFRSAFPGKEYMQSFRPEIHHKPYLIVPEWIKRWLRYAGRRRQYQGNLMNESLQYSQKRLQLLKEYEII